MNEVVKWGLIGVGGYLLYNYYVNSQTPAATTTPAGAAPPQASTPPATTQPSAPPASTPPPPAASVAIVGAVTNLGPNFSNALKANVSINGAVQSISIIPGGDAYNSAGQDISSALAAQGVNVQSLYAKMLAAYVPPSAGSAGSTANASALIAQYQALQGQYQLLLPVNPAAASSLKAVMASLALAIVAAGGTVPSGVSGFGRNYVLRGTLMPRVGGRR